AGDAYTGLLYVTELWKLYVSIAVATDGADAAGEPSGVMSRPEENPLAKRLLDFEGDNALLALTQAGLDGDAPAMEAALPAARLAYERHVTSLDRWITSLNRGAFLSKKVIQVADITLIAISFSFHGVGCRATVDGVEVDFDFGPDGRTDGFEAWRLWYFAQQNPQKYPQFQRLEDVQAALERLALSGEIECPRAAPSKHLWYLKS
ncbi:MAG TPA: hypothetical protein VE093_22730, partial [Polyangiaceae bacterium]|nr:hypothetical protein [Polyangiaceae bacterium]